MKNRNGFFITLTMVIIVICSSSLFSQDWPQFRGISRDSRVTGFKAPQTWPQNLIQIWKVNVGSGDATPVLSGKRIYLNTRQGGDEAILCLDAASGKELWKNSYPAPAVTGPSSSHPGPRSTPAIWEGKIVTFGVSGILSCIDAATGKLVWRKENPSNEVPQFFTAMSPLIVDGICIVHLGTQNKGEGICFTISDDHR
jgi:outer membrane protein assembly factor BamB